MFVAGTGTEFQVARGELQAATPSAKKKSRHKRDADATSELSVLSEMDQGYQRIEADEATSNARSARHHHSHRTRVPGTSAPRPENPPSTDSQFQGIASVPRTRIIYRTTGSPSSTSSGNSSSSNSVHRRLSSLSKRDQAVCHPETSTSVSLARRQSFTSSASALRPSKQRLERNRLLSRAHVECRQHLDRYSNNNNDNNSDNCDDADEDTPFNHSNDNEAPSKRPGSFSEAELGVEDWLYEKESVTPAEHRNLPAAALPSRARRYRNTTPQPEFSGLLDHFNGGGEEGVAEKGEAHSVRREHRSSRAVSSLVVTANATSTISDRPPSRQRHAFPTHLIDTNSFIANSSSTTSHNNNSNTRATREKSVRSATASIPISDTTTTERPPSRYMTKVKRSGQSKGAALPGNASDSAPPEAQGSPGSASGSPDSSRLPSRRCVDSVYSLNQVNHDPKTDGFADVDESVPPPFRIEITTDSCRMSASHQQNFKDGSPTISSSNQIHAKDSLHHDRSNLQSRRWSSFGNHEQLQPHTLGTAQSRENRASNNNGGGGDRDSTGRKIQIEWFGQDDQINNAHLFETIVSSPSPRFEHNFDTLDDRSSSSSSSYSAASSLEKTDYIPPQAQTSVKSTARGPPIMAVPQSSKEQQGKQISDQQWILASNNPFFLNAPAHSSSEFDDMDSETAIAQTPLYSSEDLMTLATEMSDLHLDDFIMGELQPMPISIALGAGSGGGGAPTTSPALLTSLGKDFLSLFAQH